MTFTGIPAAIVSSIAWMPASVPGIFTNRFGRSIILCRRLASSAVPCVSMARFGSTSSDTQPSRVASPRSNTGPQHVAGVPDVHLGEGEEHLLGIGLRLENLAQLLVVGVAVGDRALEDASGSR